MDTLQIIGTIAGVLTSLAVIFGALRVFYNLTKKIENAIGSDEEGRSLSDRMKKVEHQVFPNGGGSLSDQVKDINDVIIEIRTKTEVIENLLYSILGQSPTKNTTTNNKERPARSRREPSQAAKPKTTKK